MHTAGEAEANNILVVEHLVIKLFIHCVFTSA